MSRSQFLSVSRSQCRSMSQSHCLSVHQSKSPSVSNMYSTFSSSMNSSVSCEPTQIPSLAFWPNTASKGVLLILEWHCVLSEYCISYRNSSHPEPGFSALFEANGLWRESCTCSTKPCVLGCWGLPVIFLLSRRCRIPSRCHVAGSTEGQQPKIHALLNYELLHLQTYLFEARRNWIVCSGQCNDRSNSSPRLDQLISKLYNCDN